MQTPPSVFVLRLSPFFQQRLYSPTSGTFRPDKAPPAGRAAWSLSSWTLRPRSVSSMLYKPRPLSPLAGKSDVKKTLTLFWGTCSAETFSVFSLFSNILTFCTVVTGYRFSSLFCGVFHLWGRSGCRPVRGGTRRLVGCPSTPPGRHGDDDWPLGELGLGSPLVAIPHHCIFRWLRLSQEGL